MIRRSSKPYIWVTWITGLLAGTDQCVWKAWVKAHHQSYEKRPQSESSKRFLELWNREHDDMTMDRAQRLEKEGYKVEIEDVNKFTLHGSKAILGGKPDVVGIKEKEKFVLVVDEKSGKEKEQYLWQVLLYIFALTLTKFKPADGWTIRGEIEYKTKAVPVLGLSNANIERIGKVMNQIAATEPPEKVPSKWECEYCDIVGCDKRYVPPPVLEGDASNLF